MLTERFDRAVAYARILHGDHVRKGTDVPYLSHLLQVSGLVLEFGGDEDEAIAALLHDAAEDRGGMARLADIERQFGTQVAQIVRENSDSLSSSPDEKEEWQARKEAYLTAIADKSLFACRVSICDKIHNARSLGADQRVHGDSLWDRFHATREQSIWYYRELVAAFERRARKAEMLRAPLEELRRAVADFSTPG